MAVCFVFDITMYPKNVYFCDPTVMSSCFFLDAFLPRNYSMDLNQIWVGSFKQYGQLRIIFTTIGST